ncbi:MAG: FAD-dependent oxidoreductase, partial [Clostridia bacterium]|nr:FAD-dependent oxidoreductase [Clostridia bacterium]
MNETKNLPAGASYYAGHYDVAVIGGGHAGCEAALACSRLGMQTVLFAINLDTIANMPCNPSIGGTAKGHLVREIDALGGEMGRVADKTFLQSRILNRGKGPAVYSLRVQSDRRAYQAAMKHTLEQTENLDIKQAEVTELHIKEGAVEGVTVHTGAYYTASCVILATGTFLKGRIIIGDVSYSGGPDGLFPANRLSESLASCGIALRRFK